MNNFFNNGQRTPNIFERARAHENGDEGKIKPKTNIVVNTNRLWYGKDSTASAFLATAYDEQGNRIDSMEGYFLEPGTDYDRAKKAGSDTAIMSGKYDIISNKQMLKKINDIRKKNGEPEIKDLKYDWYIDDAPGRSFIAIHIGNYGKDTEGCFLPGKELHHDPSTDKYSVSHSTVKTKELFDFFENYGQNGIKINVGPNLEEWYK